MMWRKVLSIILGILVLAVLPAPFTKAQGTNVNIVILVSDNEADYTLAQKISGNLNLSVVVTVWGVYSPNVTSEIASHAPDKVLIIGGPAAVPRQYEKDLQELGIEYTRIWGETRYETNVEVLEYLFENYPKLFENVKIVIAPGMDIGAIERAKELKNVLVLYVGENYEDNQTRVLELIKAKKVIVIKTALSEEIVEEIVERVRKRLKANITEENITITADMAWEAIQLAENRTILAKSLIENVTIPSAPRLLELAEEELEDAKEAYSEGKYGKAYGKAIAAKAHAEIIIRFANEEFEEKLEEHIEFRLEIKIEKLEKMIDMLEDVGLNVTKAEGLLEQAEKALEDGDYEKAQQILEELREFIKNTFHENKMYIKEKFRERHEEREEKERGEDRMRGHREREHKEEDEDGE